MKYLNTTVGAAVAAALLSACGTSHLSRDITPEGFVNGEVVFPERASATLKEGVFPNPSGLKLLGTGVTKKQVSALIGPPHFREGVFGVREWDYIFNFRGTAGTFATCQYKIVFSKEGAAQSFFSAPEVCATALEDFEVTPEEADRLGGGGKGALDARERVTAAAKRLVGVITISGDETPAAVREAAEKLAGIVTISEVPGWVDIREATNELADALSASGNDTPQAVRAAADEVIGLVTISEVPGWVDIVHAADELGDALSASGDTTPAAVRAAAKKLVGIVTISEVPGWVDVRQAANGLADALAADGNGTPKEVKEAMDTIIALITISDEGEAPDVRADLSTDTVFGFNSTTVTPEGFATLSDLAAKIKRSGEPMRVVVQGHADRLGQPAANVDVSLRRAQAVRDVLVASGIGGAIETEGLGSTIPKMQCADNLVRSELVKCLAPNRRVVVTATSN